MRKKAFVFALLPFVLAGCSNASSSFLEVKSLLDNISSEALYPYYRVNGMIDFNNEVMEIDALFSKDPSPDTFVPYARYNEGFYNRSLDNSEDDPSNIIIYGLSSKSYFLRAPLRLTKDNFYATIAVERGVGNYDGVDIEVNYESGSIGSIGETITGAKIEKIDENTLSLTYLEGEESRAISLVRNGALENEKTFYDGTWEGGGHTLILKQGERENRTCGHYLISHLITSYMDLTGSANPSKNQMRYEVHEDGSFAFTGEKVHTNVRLDNYPYYPDFSAHPELGEWDEDDPLPCYKNSVNAKVNIRFEYDKDGWLIKEEMTSLGYSYQTATDAQISLKAAYTYKFSE